MTIKLNSYITILLLLYLLIAFLQETGGSSLQTGRINSFHKALVQSNLRLLVKYLDHGANPNQTFEDDETPLFIAIRNGNLGIVRTLLKRKANVNLKTRSGYTPVMGAIGKKSSTILLEILKFKPDLNQLSANKATALGLSLLVKEAGSAKILIEKGADINQIFEISEGDRYTPLAYALITKQSEIVALLVRSKVDVNRQCDGYTPLMYAFSSGKLPDEKSVTLLLNHGANLSGTKESGKTELELAMRQATRPRSSDFRLPQLLVDRGADINAPTRQFGTLLIEYADAGYLDAVKFLIKNKADINARNSLQRTALSYAEKRGFNDIILFLKMNGGIE